MQHLGPRNERFPNKIQKGKCHSFLATRLQNNSTFVSQSILSSKSQVSMLSLSQPCLQIQFPLLDCSRRGLRLSSPCRRSSAFSGSTVSTLMPSTPRPMVSAFGIPLRETIGERWSIHVTTTIQEIYDYIHVWWCFGDMWCVGVNVFLLWSLNHGSKCIQESPFMVLNDGSRISGRKNLQQPQWKESKKLPGPKRTQMIIRKQHIHIGKSVCSLVSTENKRGRIWWNMAWASEPDS